MKKYTVQITQYADNQLLPANCNSIAFVNTGTNSVLVSGYQLISGQSLSIDGNANEIDITQYEIIFQAGAGTNLISVIKKLYK